MIWAYTDLGMKMVAVDRRCRSLTCRSLTNWSLVADTPTADSCVKEGLERKVELSLCGRTWSKGYVPISTTMLHSRDRSRTIYRRQSRPATAYAAPSASA